jgi:hypothetical protein
MKIETNPFKRVTVGALLAIQDVGELSLKWGTLWGLGIVSGLNLYYV